MKFLVVPIRGYGRTVNLGGFHFLVADTEENSIRGFVRPSVGPLVRPSGVIELKRGKTSVFDTFCVCLSVWSRFGGGLGLDTPAHPSATIL